MKMISDGENAGWSAGGSRAKPDAQSGSLTGQKHTIAAFSRVSPRNVCADAPADCGLRRGRKSGKVAAMTKGSKMKIHAAPPPLLLLARVNAMQSWRRLKSIRDQSRLLTALILFFIVGY